MERKDEAVECDVCGLSHVTEECPELGLSSAKFTPQISRARLTVPHYLNPVELMDGGVGIMALETISNKTQLGPFEAKKTMHDIDRDDLFVLKILSKDGGFISLDASSESHCNWMALVRVAQTEEEQNCMAYQLGINIYFNTTCDIGVGDELKVWYASQYAKKLKKSLVPDGNTKSMLGEVLLTETEEGGEPELEDVMAAEEEEGEGNEDGNSHPDDVEGNFVCKHCGLRFVSQFLFAKHIRGHLFPEYNYQEGPPRRGRRPVPLKAGGYHGGGGQHRGRGRGRPRGRGRGRGRGGGRPPASAKSSPEVVESTSEGASFIEEDGEGNTIVREKEEGEAQQLSDAPFDVKTPPVVKRGRGRPKRVDVKLEPDQSPLKEELSEGGLEASVEEEPIIPPESASGRPRRSVRSFKNLGKLSKWFKYPGESSDEDDGTSGDGGSSGSTKPRKRFGIAMAASLRKAALDEISSPVKRRKTDSTNASPVVKPKSSPASTSTVTTLFGNRTTLTPGVVDITNIKTDQPDANAKISSSVESQIVATLPPMQAESSPTKMMDTGQEEDGSPKKYIVLTKGDQSSTYEISSSLVEEFEVPVSVSVSAAGGVEVSSEETIVKSISVLSGPVSVYESSSSTVVDEAGVQQHLELMEVSEVPKVEGDVIISTSEENVVTTESQQQETSRKNTIADLDGTDALTALVNAAISADKVPDPIAMVAADLYDEKNLGDDDIGDEYRVPTKHVGVETADEGDESGAETPSNHHPKPKRKKRRRGDDPELEALETMTKKVEGPNGTEEFACGVCNKHFTQFKYLKLHLPAHTDRFRCNTCGKRFARNESLLKHTCDDTASLVEPVVDEHGTEVYTCKECGRNFSQLSFAVRHASMHRTRFPCEKCGRTFPRQEMLEDHDCSAGHLEEGEVTLERYECQICKQAFTNGKYLFRHMAMHTDIYKCEVCGKCYSRKDSLQRHISRCCPELSEEYSVHVCQNCKKTFGTQLGLQNHLLNCGKYQCDACRVAFFSPKDLEEHECAGKVLNEKANVQFPCKECGKTFASIAYLVRHEASHHGAFKCDMCHRVFIRKEELNWHLPVCTIRQKIMQEGSAPCEVCGEVYNEWLAFKEHHMTHTHPHKCDKCGKRFIKIGTLHNHKCDGMLENGEVASLLSCEICQKTFKNERYLSRHLSLHGQPEYACEFCGKLFIRKDYLNDHQCRMPDGSVVRVIRKKNRLFIKDNLACPECGKTFSSRSNMMKHMKVHGEKQAECPICHKKFHYDNYLKLHIATVHEKQYQLQCKHCGKVLFSKTGLIAHIKQFHAETIQLYPCPKCGKTFRQKGNMKTHLISHTKERAFKCDICGKAFKYPDQLNRHRLEHTLTEKYSCDMCDKQFVRNYELRNHVRNYHSGFVYVCGVCHECCAHRHTIIRHYKRKHPEVGNVFEEKPEFLDSLQKPVTAATQSRMMVEHVEDVKPTIMRLGGQEIIVTTEEDGTQTYTTGDVILTQNAAGELMASDGDHGIHQVVEGGAQGDQTVFILKVVNQDENGSLQEMEITEDTKAHLAQLIQAHGVGPDITHIQVGDQTLQIQHEEGHSVMLGQGHEAKTEDLSQLQSVATVTGGPATQPGNQPRQQLVTTHHLASVTAGQNSGNAVSHTASSSQQQPAQQQVVSLVMPDGQLGQLISVDGEVTAAGVGLGRVGTEDEGEDDAANVAAAAGQGQVIQFMEVDENGQMVLTTASTAPGHSHQGIPIMHQATQPGTHDGPQELPGIKVRKRRRSNGEIVVEVEGEAGNLLDLGADGGQMVMDLVQGHEGMGVIHIASSGVGEEEEEEEGVGNGSRSVLVAQGAEEVGGDSQCSGGVVALIGGEGTGEEDVSNLVREVDMAVVIGEGEGEEVEGVRVGVESHETGTIGVTETADSISSSSSLSTTTTTTNPSSMAVVGVEVDAAAGSDRDVVGMVVNENEVVSVESVMTESAIVAPGLGEEMEESHHPDGDDDGGGGAAIAVVSGDVDAVGEVVEEEEEGAMAVVAVTTTTDTMSTS